MVLAGLDCHTQRFSHGLGQRTGAAPLPGGVEGRVAQALARHAKVETTMGVYTDLAALDLRGAVESVAVGSEPRRSPRSATA